MSYDSNFTIFFNSLGSIYDNIHKDLAELMRIAQHFRYLTIIFYQRGFVFELVSEHVQCCVQTKIDIRLLELAGTGMRKIFQICYYFPDSLGPFLAF